MAELYTQEEQQHLDAAHAAIMKSSAVDLCSIWHTVEPHWSAIITMVKKIPIFGGKLAALLTAFGTALDACCPKQSKAAEGGVTFSAEERAAVDEVHAAVFGTKASQKPCCNIWDKVKGKWSIIVAIAKKVSPKLGDILQKLGDALNKFCAG